MKFRRILITGVVSLFVVLQTGVAVNAQCGVYKVCPGDTMDAIAKKYQIDLKELLKANPQCKDKNVINPGQKVTIPSIDNITKFEEEVVRLVNAERAKVGQPALTQDANLTAIARLKSQDFIDKNYFAHQSPTYGSPFDMMKKYGVKFTAAGENIAKYQRTPAEVMNAWMNSAGHKANILSSSFNKIGVGVAKDSKGNLYWTQLFIRG